MFIMLSGFIYIYTYLYIQPLMFILMLQSAQFLPQWSTYTSSARQSRSETIVDRRILSGCLY